MALKSSFFNSINGDRRYDARVFAEYFASFIGNGVFPNPSSNLQVVEGGNMTTIIRSGKAWINGYFLINDTDYVLTHDNADGVLKRIDRIILRLNYVARQIEIVIKKGTFASSPTAPTLQRDNDIYELAIADVLINNGATQITQANITDTRLNNALCGVIHGTVNQVDTTSIFNQYLAKLEELDTVLDGDVAANILAIINAHKGDLASQAVGKGASLIGIHDAESLFTSTNVEGALKELFTSANDIKTKWASVVGSPLLSTDTQAQLQSKTQTLKNTLAANLTNKGQSSTGTETLSTLINKVPNINTSNIKSIQRGTIAIPSGTLTITASITSVVNANSIIRILTPNAENSSNAASNLVAGEFVSNTQIRLTRTGSSGAINVRYEVIEFQNIKSLQKGIATPTSDIFAVTVNTIDTLKSLLFITYTNSYGTSVTSYMPEYYIKNSTAIEFDFPSSGYQSTFKVYWQLVEFN